jgi:hypothetical protein
MTSRYIIAWKPCTTMRADDVTDTLQLALTRWRSRAAARFNADCPSGRFPDHARTPADLAQDVALVRVGRPLAGSLAQANYAIYDC